MLWVIVYVMDYGYGVWYGLLLWCIDYSVWVIVHKQGLWLCKDMVHNQGYGI